MEDNEIKSALDSFEDDDFLAAKEKLKKQIILHKNEYLKNKLGLQKDIEPVEQPADDKTDVKHKKTMKKLMRK